LAPRHIARDKSAKGVKREKRKAGVPLSAKRSGKGEGGEKYLF